MERLYLNTIKKNYEKPTANIITDGKELKAFPATSTTGQGCSLTTSTQKSTGSTSQNN